MATGDLDYSKLGPNIRGLRESFGETQLDLAYAIGLNSASAIANYENGDRVPNRDMLIRIAKHYHVTATELVNGNFSTLKNISNYSLHDKAYNQASLDKLLPLICTDKALENNNFRKAYNLHQTLYNCLVQGADTDLHLFDECTELYKAAKKDGIIEASANLLWWIMLWGLLTVFLTPQVIENIEKIQSKDAILKDYLSLGILPEFGEGAVAEYTEAYESSRSEYLEEYEAEMMFHIRQLKQHSNYTNLADYYIALRYEFNLLSNSLTAELNRAVGDEMLVTFSVLGNPYAKAFITPTPRSE